jgi:hypothetical protein
MKEHKGSAERWVGKRQIDDQIDPDSQDFGSLSEEEALEIEGGAKDLYEGVSARDELEKAMQTYFNYLAEIDRASTMQDKEVVVEECKVLLRIILKIEEIYKISRKGTIRILGQICRSKLLQIEKNKMYTDDKILGESIFADIVRRASGRNDFGVS